MEKANGCQTHIGFLSPKTFDSEFLHMFFVEFMWNFLSPTRASYWLLGSFWPPEPKNVWFLLSRHDVCRLHEKFSSRRFARAIGCYIQLDLITPKTFDSYFLDMMYVGFMKNFLLADSCELLAVRLSLSSWGQKRLIPTFYTWCTSGSWKIFFSPIRASYWLLDSFRPPEPKNAWFLLSRHEVRRDNEKFSSRPLKRADDGC